MCIMLKNDNNNHNNRILTSEIKPNTSSFSYIVSMLFRGLMSNQFILTDAVVRKWTADWPWSVWISNVGKHLYEIEMN